MLLWSQISECSHWRLFFCLGRISLPSLFFSLYFSLSFILDVVDTQVRVCRHAAHVTWSAGQEAEAPDSSPALVYSGAFVSCRGFSAHAGVDGRRGVDGRKQVGGLQPGGRSAGGHGPRSVPPSCARFTWWRAWRHVRGRHNGRLARYTPRPSHHHPAPAIPWVWVYRGSTQTSTRLLSSCFVWLGV